MNALRLLPAALRELGVRSMLNYGAYVLGLRSGWIRTRTSAYRWEDRPLQAWLDAEVSRDQVLRSREPFFFDPYADLSGALSLWDGTGTIAVTDEAEGILGGAFRLFGGESVRVGFPPDWNDALPAAISEDPVTLAADRHWSDYPLEGSIDFKLVWELSRFAWIYPLARAYRLTGDGKFWDGCKQLLNSWLELNPPNHGPQWISAQEVAVRLLAMSFAWHAFAPELDEDPDFAQLILTAIGAHAERIPPTLRYAKAQRNNHLLVEAAALYSAGLLFPGLRRAVRWKALGRGHLQAALLDQVFPDGGYVQHSINYHRMALQSGLWSSRLAQVNAEPLESEAVAAIRRLALCLQALVDPGSGAAPNLGHNDGSQFLPLASCGYADQRPGLQAAARLFDGVERYPNGAWDELSFWLGLWNGGADREHRADRSPPEAFPHAGLHLLRGDHSWAMLRCAHFHNRPAHSDQLHLDLWWRGLNVALDPGTYRYSAPAPWDQALSPAAAHNGVTLTGLDPMRRAGRFLWLDWAQGQLLDRRRSTGGDLELLAAKHTGFRRLNVTVLRTVLRAGSDLWLVIDELVGSGRHRASATWTFPDWEWTLKEGVATLHDPAGHGELRVRLEHASSAIIRCGELLAGDAPNETYSTHGWQSPTYNDRQPALSLLASADGELPLRMLTWLAFGVARPEELEIVWEPPGRVGFPLSSAAWNGEALQIGGP